MNLFIDGGASNGCITNQFIANHAMSHWTVYLFEPSPRHKKSLIETTQKRNNIFYIQKALWIENCQRILNDFGEKYESNNILSDDANKQVDYLGNLQQDKYIVECIDFIEWIKQNIGQFNYKILKLDIEGSEFPILERMMKENLICLFDEYWIEFHARFNREKYSLLKDEIVNSFKLHNKKFISLK